MTCSEINDSTLMFASVAHPTGLGYLYFAMVLHSYWRASLMACSRPITFTMRLAPSSSWEWLGYLSFAMVWRRQHHACAMRCSEGNELPHVDFWTWHLSWLTMASRNHCRIQLVELRSTGWSCEMWGGSYCDQLIAYASCLRLKTIAIYR